MSVTNPLYKNPAAGDHRALDHDGPLAGRQAWVITDGAAGLVVQARGLAEALGLQTKFLQIAPRGIWKTLAPWAPVSPSERFGQSGSQFAPPWPDVAIASGRLAIPYIRALHRKAGLATYTIILQDPKASPKSADLIWVPAHDKRRGANVITTPTSPHSFGPKRLAALRAEMPTEIAALPGPRVAVILGGRTKTYPFPEADHNYLSGALASLGRLGASFMITPSRRSHPALIDAVVRATDGFPRLLWDGEGDNPYPNFLAHADVFVVTGDSTNMCGEAAATGRPIYVFEPAGGSAKFQRFHEGLQALGATRPLPEQINELETWSYQPLDSTRVIADEIEKRFAQRQANLSGSL